MPSTATIAVKGMQQFTATGSYKDGTTQNLTMVGWSSSSNKVAKVNGSGLATRMACGTATISAKSGSVTGSATLSVQ